MPLTADVQRRVGHMAKIRDLPIHFRGHRNELVAKAKIHGEISPQPDVVLRKESEQTLAIAADRIDPARQGEIELVRDASQEIFQPGELKQTAHLAGRELIELEPLAVETQADSVCAAGQENGVTPLPRV